MKLGIYGAGGRMGRRIAALLEEFPELELHRAVGRGDAVDFEGCEVVIDVAVAGATEALLGALGEIPLVTGVTGRSEAQEAALRVQASRAPVFVAANFSVGVAALGAALRQVLAAMPEAEVEVFELHHRHKADAPSGTALELGRVAAEAQGIEWPRGRALREGATGPRSRSVGLAAGRGGEVVGEHTVYVFGAGERVELVHRAVDRSIFARGALRAAEWVAKRAPGRYGMEDLVRGGLSSR